MTLYAVGYDANGEEAVQKREDVRLPPDEAGAASKPMLSPSPSLEERAPKRSRGMAGDFARPEPEDQVRCASRLSLINSYSCTRAFSRATSRSDSVRQSPSIASSQFVN